MKYRWLADNLLQIVYGEPRFDSLSINKMENRENIGSEYELSTVNDLLRVKKGRITLVQDIDFVAEEDKTKLIRKMPLNVVVYGFGDKTGPLNRIQRKYIFFNTDDILHTETKDPLYKSLPFFIFFNDRFTYGIFVDHPGYIEIDLDSKATGRYEILVRDSGFTQYIILGNNIKEVVKNFLKLFGENYVPPIWAFGHQQSRYSYETEKELFNIAYKYRKKQIPCDVLYLDIDYMDSYKVFTWNKENFPKPHRMTEKLHEIGFKLSAIIDPGIKVEEDYEIYEEGKTKGFFIKDSNGKDFEGAVWPGRVNFPDFLREDVRKWWGNKYRKLVEDGIDGFWNDMNEPSIFATDNFLKLVKEAIKELNLEDGILIPKLLSDYSDSFKKAELISEEPVHTTDSNKKVPHSKIKNIYGYMMSKACFEGLKSNFPNKRFLLLSRSAYIGSHKYTGVWTGDNHSWWNHLHQEISRICNLSICGFFYSGFDVGGFSENTTPELLVRFYQLGSFIPLFRNHSNKGTINQEPWVFGKRYEKIIKKTIENRYSLIPYIYSNYMLGILNNEPFIRPLSFDFQKDPKTWNIDDQFMFGTSIMVAPVTKMGMRERAVYFPESSWLDLNNYEIVSKGWKVVKAPLETIPYFQKVDTAIIRMEPMNYIFEKEIELLTFEIFLDKGFEFYYYEDDGITYDFKNDKYSLRKIQVSRDKIKITTLKNSYKSTVKFWNFVIKYIDGVSKEIRVDISASQEPIEIFLP
ncbi:MAG: alpha-glucosidase [Thermotogaceae bacterium]|jgi:alpha-glucosidase|nr:alpha-glucosidase [Thermotogaceae bacterium]